MGQPELAKQPYLRKFAHELDRDQWIYLQPSRNFHNPEQFLSALISILSDEGDSNVSERQNSINLNDVIQTLNGLSKAKKPFLIVFDSFDYWKPIEDWFFDQFLPRLSVHLRLFTASRNPLGNERKEVPRWSRLVMNVALKPLDYLSIHEYILKSGIQTPQIRETIARLSNGIPLALNLFTNKVGENIEPFNTAKLAHTIHILIQTVIDGLDLSETQRQQLLAASIVWRFDIDLLSHMMEQPISSKDFQQLCNLPLVTKCVDGWSLLDGVRDWIRNDFKSSAPDTYYTYKKKAFERLYQRWLTADFVDSEIKSDRFINMLYMVENEEVKNYYYRGGHVQYFYKTLTEEQLPIIENMWREWFPEVPPFQADQSRQEVFFRPIWLESPSAFTTFWDGDHLAAFCAVVPLNETTRTILQHNAPYRNYIVHSEPKKDEVLLWIGAPADKNDFEASSIVFRYFLQQLMNRKIYTIVTPVENHMKGLLALGFTRLTWADYTSPDEGLTYYVLQLDLTNKDLIAMLFHPSAIQHLPTQEEANQIVKKMLAHFHNLKNMNK